MYKRIIWQLRGCIEVEEHHDGRYGAPGQKREKKKKPTKETMAWKNQKNKEATARRKIAQHFEKNDYFTRLSYRVDERPPDMATAKQHFRKFYTEVRKEYRKRGYELKWIDYITGMMASKVEAVEHPSDPAYGWSSKKGAVGIAKKVGYLCVIAVAMVLDYTVLNVATTLGITIPNIKAFLG